MDVQVGNMLRSALEDGRKLLAALGTGAQESGDGRVDGMVEEFSKRLVTGWISVPADAAPERVELCIGDLVVGSTYATPDSPPFPGPEPAGRNSGQQIRTFSFRVRGIWPWVKRSTRITLRVNGRPLPIHGHGMFLTPPRDGKRSVKALAARLEDGYLLTHTGRFVLSKQLDTAWQGRVMDLYTRVRAVLHDDFGLDAFLMYGSLLGAVREGGYIGHDSDFDAGYLSTRSDPREAAAEYQEIALALVRHGFHVEAHPASLHVHDRGSEERIELFHTFFDTQDVLRIPFGITGRSMVTRNDWQGVREVEWPGGKALLPVNAEQLAEHIYGEDWRVPKQGFVWRLDKTDSAPEAELSTEQRTKIYWASFYAQTHYTSGSTFFEFVSGWPGIPDNVIDIGCGDGRDSCAFGTTGRHVLGVDQSPVGIENASQQAEERGLGDRVSFRTCDVADVTDLGHAMDEITQRTEGPVAFYMRFFLHAIPEDVQRGLMHAIDTHARPGDFLVAEFRTDKDAENTKVHTKHYRRFQNAEVFRSSLGEHGFEVLHFEENNGLSPYKGEDPVLCRAVARR